MAKFRFRLWHLIPLSIPVIYMMTDYSVNAADIASSYMSQETKGVESNKAAFIVQYRQAVEAKANAGKFDPVEGINISTDLFTDTCIRLNTEAYQISKEELDCWKESIDLTSDCKLFEGYVQFINPLIPIATIVGETGSAYIPTEGSWKPLTNKAVLWTPAVYENLFELYCEGFDINSLFIDDVGTEYYLDRGLYYVDDCGKGDAAGRGKCTANNSEHDAYWHANNNLSLFNDNDSLGPLQILRKYLGIVNGQPGTIKAYGGREVKDLLKWRDNTIYYFNEYGNSFKKVKTDIRDKEITNVYQLVVLAAIAHNTGPGYLTNAAYNSGPVSVWKNAAAIYQFSKDITTLENIAVLQSKVDEWYEQKVANDTKGGNEFEFFGSSVVEGDGGRRRAKEMYDNELNMSADEYLKFSTALDMQVEWDSYVEDDDGNVVLNAHKSRYPLKALLNYMCLEKLYQSGMQ